MAKRSKKGAEACPRAIDLFAGCGGLTEGLKQAGFEVLGAVEIDPVAARTYVLNHSSVHVWNIDIRTITGADVLKEFNLRKGELELLAGCPPCQGFSTMRTLNGKLSVDDPQNSLLLEFLRLVEELQPRAIMMENVPGLAQDQHFKDFCSRLAALGYKGEAKILNAADFRVPQRRRRLIYLASLASAVPFARPSARPRTVRDAFAKLKAPGVSGDAIHDLPEKRSKKVRQLIRSIPKDGGSRSDLPLKKQLKCHKSCNGFKDVYGRMSWDRVAPTITGGCFNPSKGRFLHPDQNRAITVREAALLQGFPRRYKFDATDGKSAIALMIGNALPPPFICAHARRILSTLKKSKKPSPNEKQGVNQNARRYQSGLSRGIDDRPKRRGHGPGSGSALSRMRRLGKVTDSRLSYREAVSSR
ncbi:MAG: DNA cytosine methyltransferase [Edaphobacter sp.]